MRPCLRVALVGLLVGAVLAGPPEPSEIEDRAMVEAEGMVNYRTCRQTGTFCKFCK